MGRVDKMCAALCMVCGISMVDEQIDEWINTQYNCMDNRVEKCDSM